MEYFGEIWKDIPSFVGVYQVSNLGRVKSFDRVISTGCGSFKSWKGREMKTTIDSLGYKIVGLCKDGTRTLFKVHRLVAGSFLDNPLNLPQVNHIDGCKSNNVVSNLEWCTASQNVQHAFDTGLKVVTNEDKRFKAKGYSINKVGNYKAQVTINRRQIHLGTFKTECEARGAYKTAVKQLLNLDV